MCSRRASHLLKPLLHLTTNVEDFQACCSPEINYDLITLKKGQMGVMNGAPGVEGRGGWGFQMRSPEWWRSPMNVREHAVETGGNEWDYADHHQRTVTLAQHPEPLGPAGQLFAEQQCDAVLHGLWIPSGSSWRARCCWMENKPTIKVNGPSLLFTCEVPLPACGRVLNQPFPLFLQLGQDCHPSLVWEGWQGKNS